MEDLFGINAHRLAVQENIAKAFDLGFDVDNNIEGIEKAKHNVGDIHPNGRWVWTEWAPGKFDWKSLKGKHHKGNQQATTQQQTTDDKEVSSFMDKVKTFSSKYNDPSKISVSKTPKGNWNVHYDGKRLGIFNASTLSEETAKAKGWLKEEKSASTDNSKKPKIKRVNNIDVRLDIVNEVLDETLKKFPKGSDRTKAMNFAASKLRSNTKWMLPFTVVNTYLHEVMSEYNDKIQDDNKDKDVSTDVTKSTQKNAIEKYKDVDLSGAVIQFPHGKFKVVGEKNGKVLLENEHGVLEDTKENMLKRMVKVLSFSQKNKDVSTDDGNSGKVDEYINKMADDSKWAALVEVIADVDLSDYETEEEAKEAIRSKVSLKKLESAWKKFNKQ